MFESWRKKGNTEERPKPEGSRKVQIIADLRKSKELFDLVTKEIFARGEGSFKSLNEVKQQFAEVKTSTQALRVARMIDSALGTGTFRKLAFVSSGTDAPKNVFKILRKDLEKSSFDKQVERGHYLNITENYDIQWNLEKVARDVWQNFFDANEQTVDGVRFDKEAAENTASVKISAKQEYDWRELAHVGGTTKKGDTRAAGGFGEGTKDLALILLRDYGASRVQYASGEWILDFYLDTVPKGTYREPIRGLYIKKEKRDSIPGNSLEIVFEGPEGEARADDVLNARELFYSRENPDFRNPSYNNPDIGGFAVLLRKQRIPESTGRGFRQQGHFYQAGQRMHYDDRDKWEKVNDMNIWTWEKILPKDRDRGMVTPEEMREKILPFIVDSMGVASLTKSVYDFKPLWDELLYYETSYQLLERIVLKLEKNGVKLAFDQEYLAGDLGFDERWINELLKTQGYKICPEFMSKVGMKKVSERFVELQSHSKVEATPEEMKKIELLKGVAKAVELPETEIKDIWIFSAKDEKSIFHGQYNGMFYWLAREGMQEDFLHAVYLYTHEAAHSKGPHGKPQFEYYNEELKEKVQRFIKDHREQFAEWEKEWELLGKQ